MRAANAVTPKAADVIGQGRERVFDARLPDLFKAFVVRGPTAHAIKILWDHRMVVVRRLKPVQIHRAGVTRVGGHGEADLRAAAGVRLREARQIADYDIWPRDTPSGRLLSV